MLASILCHRQATCEHLSVYRLDLAGYPNWTFDKAAPWADTDAVLAHIYEYKKGKQKTDISLLGNPIKGGLPRFK
jgi:hypothetical protein